MLTSEPDYFLDEGKGGCNPIRGGKGRDLRPAIVYY